MKTKSIQEAIRARFSEDPCVRDAAMILTNLYKLMCPALLEHTQELAESCETLARHLGKNREEQKTAFLGGLLHDVGHLMSPGKICNWKGDGPPAPRNMEAEHPDYGQALLEGADCLKPILAAVRHHHEFYNGSGFPDGLGGTDIPELARLVAVAHHYQTLIRGYRTTQPLTVGEAMRVMEEDAGVLLDPEMTRVFLLKVAC